MSAGNAPRTWCLLGPKAGDNNQILALAAALGWPCEQRQLRFHWHELLSNRIPRGALPGLDKRHSDVLAPPWPELVLTAGRRNEAVAQWLRQQSGGRTRIVHLGRPWAALKRYDLIITTPQYSLPDAPQVLRLDLPLHNVGQNQLESAAAAWAPRLSQLARPYTAVLVGGNSGKYVFTDSKARRLGKRVNALLARQGGTVLATSSARTPARAYAAFLATLKAPVHAFHWRAGSASDNPYLAYLALADALVVTGESMSMLAEAAATGKPLYIFDMADTQAQQRRWWLYPRNYRLKPLSHRLSMLLGPPRIRRDITGIQQGLVQAGRAQWLDQTQAEAPGRSVKADAELTRAATAVRALFVVKD